MPSINFKGKNAVWNHHLSVPYQILEKDKKLSLKGKNEDENLIIEADNLIALKSLLPKYQGRIKCIYIDPPYNTGNENWTYSDNVSSPLIKDWMGKAVDREDLTRHDKWLCMMTPRLKLLRELLTEDGVIFVSIDDIEIHRLRMLMDEIFGEEAFVAEFIWKSRQNKDNRNVTGASIDHEYVLCYGSRVRGSERKTEQYTNPDHDPRGPWVSGNMVGLLPEELRPNCHYDLINPKSKVNYGKPKLGWRYDKNTMDRLMDEKKIIWPATSSGRPRRKVFLSELQQRFTGYSSIIGNDIFTRDGTAEMEQIFGKRVLDFPKPSRLIWELIVQGCEDNDIILDSFAGSAPTAQAVLELNEEDGGNRKFILVECENYTNTITAERVRRVIKRDKLDVGFSYMTLGAQIDADSILSGKLPTYKEFAKYVYYLATGKTMDNEKSINEKDYFAGKTSNESIYLMYEKDKDKLKKLAITLEWAEQTNKKDKGKKIIYAPACFLDEEYLEKFNIHFVSIPYNLFEKK